MVNREHGLIEAKDFLRHADIAITAAHYIAARVKRPAASALCLKLRMNERSSIPLESRPADVLETAKSGRKGQLPSPNSSANALPYLMIWRLKSKGCW
jgi:hypothetical protein